MKSCENFEKKFEILGDAPFEHEDEFTVLKHWKKRFIITKNTRQNQKIHAERLGPADF